MSELVEMYTDGACRGNPGKGGWGVLLRYNDAEKTLYGGEKLSTNNRMELTAVIKGLEALTKSCQIKITTDSKYVLQGVTEWMPNWKKRNWRTANKKPVLNIELWQQNWLVLLLETLMLTIIFKTREISYITKVVCSL